MHTIELARSKGFEPPTLGSEDQCSNPLSYERNHKYDIGGHYFGNLTFKLDYLSVPTESKKRTVAKKLADTIDCLEKYRQLNETQNLPIT